MLMELTPAFVAKAKMVDDPEIKPKADRAIFWDTHRNAPRGFGLMVTAGGHRSFVIQYRHKGKSRRMKLDDGLTLDKARARAKKLLGNRSEVDPLAERRRAAMSAANTVKSVCDEYFTREAGMKSAAGSVTFKGGKLRTAKDRYATLERLVFPRLGKRQIDDIQRSDITRLLDQIEDERGAVMADRALAYLRRVFNWHAERTDGFNSPIVRAKSRANVKDRARKRVLDDHELRVVWEAAKPADPFGALIRFILLTATRRNEAAKMRRSEIIGADWIIPAARYKTKLDHLIPLSTSAQELLAGVPQIGGSDAHVFTTDTKKDGKAKPGERAIGGFGKAKDKLDERVLELLRKSNPGAEPLPNWTLHDLRRTARSLMSRAGVLSDHAERALGHTMPGIRGTYDRFAYRDEKAKAFDALAAQIDRILDPVDNITQLRAQS